MPLSITHGPLRLSSPIAPETPLGQNEPEEVCPAQSWSEGSAGLGLDHEPEKSRLQPGLQSDDPRVPGRAGVLVWGDRGRDCRGRRHSQIEARTHAQEHPADRQAAPPENSREGQAISLRHVPEAKPKAREDSGTMVLPAVSG